MAAKSTPANVRLGNWNIEYFERFEERVGTFIEFRQDGYLYLYHSEETEQAWRERERLYSDHDASVEFLSPADVAETVSLVDPDSYGVVCSVTTAARGPTQSDTVVRTSSHCVVQSSMQAGRGPDGWRRWSASSCPWS